MIKSIFFYQILICSFFSIGCTIKHYDEGLIDESFKAKVYSYIDKTAGADGQLILNPDNTFNYSLSIGLINQKSKGSWSNDKDSIILKSDLFYKNDYVVHEIRNNYKINDSIIIKLYFKDYDNTPVPLALVSIGENKTSFTDEKGIAVFHKENIQLIKIKYFEEYELELNNNPSGDIDIYLSEKSLSKVYFDNEVWKKDGENIFSSQGVEYKLKK